MRIAPKPQAGQEISLDDLLKTQSKPAIKQPQYNPISIIEGPTSFTLDCVETYAGYRKIELLKELAGPISWTDIHKAQGRKNDPYNGFRPIAADEFYAVLAQVVEAGKQLNVELNGWPQLRAWIQDRWNNFGIFGLRSYAIYSGNAASDVILHRPDLCDETVIQENISHDTALLHDNFARAVFNTTWNELCSVWLTLVGRTPAIRTFKRPSGQYSHQSAIVASRDTISSRDETGSKTRHTILVKTTKVQK